MSPVKYHYFHCFFTYSVRRNACAVRYGGGCHGVLEPSVRVAPGRRVASLRVSVVPVSVLLSGGRPGAARAGVRFRGCAERRFLLPRDPIRGHCQAGSLTGAVHLSNNNAGVLRPAQRGQKPRVEQKGKCWLDPDVQYA